MKRLGMLLLSLAAAGALALLGTGSALASSCPQSAGDQQYVDPLAGCPTKTTHTTPPPTNTTPPPANTTPAPASTTSTPSTSATAPAAVASTTTTAAAVSAPDPHHTPALPFTGFNVWLAVALGAALLGAGLALRRSVVSA